MLIGGFTMKLTFRPRTSLGKLSIWALLYFLVTWIIVAFVRDKWGGAEVTRSFINWILMLLTVSGIIGAFVSLFGSLVAIVWREDRSFIGILVFILSVPVCALVASFLLGSYFI